MKNRAGTAAGMKGRREKNTAMAARNLAAPMEAGLIAPATRKVTPVMKETVVNMKAGAKGRAGKVSMKTGLIKAAAEMKRNTAMNPAAGAAGKANGWSAKAKSVINQQIKLP